MDEFLDRIGSLSTQDSFELAATEYFEELDRRGGRELRPEAAAPAEETAGPDWEDLPADLDDSLDSLALRLMTDTEASDAPRGASTAAPVRKEPKKPPFMRRKSEPAAPAAPSAQDRDTAPLSQPALEAARLFETLPTEDQLLAYTLLRKLAKAAERS